MKRITSWLFAIVTCSILTNGLMSAQDIQGDYIQFKLKSNVTDITFALDGDGALTFEGIELNQPEFLRGDYCKYKVTATDGMVTIKYARLASFYFDNKKESQLITLDVTHASELREIFIEGQKDIQSVDLSQNPKLKNIYFRYCYALRDINFGDNQLKRLIDATFIYTGMSELDFSHSKSLESVQCTSSAVRKLLVPTTATLQAVRCADNIINGINMGALVNRLPDHSNDVTEDNRFFFQVEVSGKSEGNVFYDTHLIACMGKGWTAVNDKGYPARTTKEPTAIDAVDALQVKAYPNPAVDQLFVDGVKAYAELTLVNMAGLTVKSKQADADGVCRIDVSDLPQGEYLLMVSGQSVKVAIQ